MSEKSEMKEKKKNQFGTVVIAIMAAVFIVISMVVLFVPQIGIREICYFCCGILIVLGIYMIVRYFMTEGYQRFGEYGFSVGVLSVLLGVCGIIKAEEIAFSFLGILGLALLLSGVVKLQYALDLKCMEDKAWAWFFGVTLALLGCGVAILLKPFSERQFYQNFTCVVLLADGVAALVNIVYLQFRTKTFRERMEETAEPVMPELSEVNEGGEENPESADGKNE